MRCLSCMTVNPAGNRFCENCGSQFKLTCAQCGHDCLPTARFCGTCGSSLVASPASGTPGPEALPKWGELKYATVLFADIVGSTEHIAALDAEQAMGRMRPAVLRMCHSVERFGGTVIRTLGDGVMALFGVPNALEGHALLACEAALHMQRAFSQDPQGLKIRVGLHSGHVASDPQDAQTGRGGGAHGLTIHLASRVVALAQPGGICLTQACRALVAGACEVLPLGAQMLKGIGGTVDIYVLESLKSGAGYEKLPGVALSPFRGRQRELASLIQALDAAAGGAASAIGIAGEPGSGKSRLCQELAQVARGHGTPVYEVRAQLYGHAMPLQPVLELFRTYFFGILPADSADVARQRIAQAAAGIAPTSVDLGLLYEFFGVAHPGGAPLPLGPKARQARLLGLVRNLVRLQAHIPRLILIEDLHWLDEASEEFVSALVDAVGGTRTLLLLNYRPTYRSPWSQVPHFAQMELRELPTADMDTLVGELLAPLSALPDICRLVVERSGGNPFFAEELVRTLAETGVLAPDTGLPIGGLEAVERALPVNVQAVIGARLDRLGEPEKTLLQMCAIIGKDIPLAVLERVASPLAAQIEKGLAGLCHADLILPQPTEGGRRFAFRHPLIQEVAYTTQLKVRRGSVHSSVAAAMETYYAEQLDEYAGLIAYHYEEAGHSLQSAHYNSRAANWVGSTNAAQAIKHWRKVRAMLQAVSRTPDVDKLRVTAGGKIALLGWREGLTLHEVQPFIDEALGLAAEGDDRMVPWLLTVEGRMLVASGGPADGYVSRAQKALLYIDVDRDPGRAATAHAFLSQAYSWAGMLREALQSNDASLANIAHVDPLDQQFIGFSIEQWILGMRGRLLTRLGRLEQARECLQRMLAIEATSAELPVHGMSRFGFVELAWSLKDAELAREHAVEMARLADQHGSPYLRAFSLGCSGTAATLDHRHDGALRHFGDALELIRSSGAAMEYETEILAGMAESHLRAGDAGQAHDVASEAIELSQRRATRLAQCRALITRGAAALAMNGGGRSEAADRDFAQAEELILLTGAAGFGPSLMQAREGLMYSRAA